jgi:hypothetical protein
MPPAGLLEGGATRRPRGFSFVVVGQPEHARVTVVIPTYNRAQWLAGAIESVLEQTYPALRLVVSDNASTDATERVVERFDDPRLAIVRRPRNLELNAHWNACIADVRTEYLLLLPDDDRLAPDAVAAAVAVLDAHPRAGLVHGRVDVLDRHGVTIAVGHDMTGLDGDAVESGAAFIRRTMELSFRVHASTALIRTEALRGLALEDADFPATDLGLWLRLALGWDVAFLARRMASYRVHGDSYSSRVAAVTDGGYVQSAERIVAVRDVKLRFVAAHADRLAGAGRLRATARRAFRRELLEHAAQMTPRRRLGPALAALRGCVRLDPWVALEPGAWRLIASGVIGPRAVAAIKRRLGRPSLRPAA